MEELFRLFQVSFYFHQNLSNKFDIVTRIPRELSTYILRMLRTTDLIRATLVSQEWRNICLNDPLLRKRIENFLEDARRNKINKENCTPFDYHCWYGPSKSWIANTNLSGVCKLLLHQVKGKRKRKEHREETNYKRPRTIRT